MSVGIQKLTLKKILEPNVELLVKLDEQYFKGVYKTLYKTIYKYYNKHRVILSYDDLNSIIQANVAKDKIDIYLTTLSSINNVKSNLTSDVILNKLIENSTINLIENKAEDFINAIKDKNIEELKELIDVFQQNLLHQNEGTTKDIRDVEFKEIELASTPCFLKTLREYDVDLMGLTIIGGLSGGGKSIFAINQALYEHDVNENKVSLYSLELPTSIIDMRLYANINNISFNEVKNIPNLKEVISKWKKEYFKPDSFYINYMRYDIEKLKKAILFDIQRGVKVFIIDYLNLVEYSVNSEDWKQLASFVKELHTIAMTYGVVIITPTQVDVSENVSKELNVTTRGSRELEFSSSVFLLLYRNKEEEKEKLLRLFIQKARNAQKLTMVLEDNFKCMKFKDTGVVL